MSNDPQLKQSSVDWTPERIAMEAEALARIQAMEAAPPPVKRQRAAPQPFLQAHGACETHGRFPINMLDAEGVERWLSPECPVCQKQAAVGRLMRRAAISPRFERCTFENFKAETEKQKASLEICIRYAEEFAAARAGGACLILRGNPGTGKNHLAAAITRRIMEDGFSALNATAFEIIRRIRDTWRADSAETEAEVTQLFAGIDLLIIDEVGRQYQAKDGADSVELFNVIDARYRALRPTLIISNQDRDGLKKFLGAAAYDRLREGGGKIANFDWESARA